MFLQAAGSFVYDMQVLLGLWKQLSYGLCSSWEAFQSKTNHNDDVIKVIFAWAWHLCDAGEMLAFRGGRFRIQCLILDISAFNASNLTLFRY